MNIFYLNEHLKCYNYDHREKPQIELAKILAGQTKEITVTESEIVFFMDGQMRLSFNDLPDCEGVGGEFVFLPAGGKYSATAIVDSYAVIFRLNKAVNLCENFMLDKLFEQLETMNHARPRIAKSLSALEIIPPLWYFLRGVIDRIEDGIKCRCFFDMKIKELLLLMRVYYTEDQLHDFFYLILSVDTAFSEYVRLKWDQFGSIEDLAKSMQYSRKQFSTRFVKVFGMNPNKWMIEARASKIYSEITSTHKKFKQIAAENLFYSDAYFTNFCKTMFGGSPSELRAGKAVAQNVQNE